MNSNALLIVAIFCLACAAGQSDTDGTDTAVQASNGLYDLCQDCVIIVEKIYALSNELKKEGVDFFSLPVPCGLINDESEICDRLLDEVHEIPRCEVCDAYKICARINYCYGSSHLPVPPPRPKIIHSATNQSISVDILADSFCYGCKRIMKKIRSDTMSLDKVNISKKLDKECQQFRGILKVYCSTLVKLRRDSLIYMLVERRPQATICDGLNQCSFPYCKACYNFAKDFKNNPNASTTEPCASQKPVMSAFCSASLDYSKNLIKVLLHRQDLMSYRLCYTLAYCPRRDHDLNLLQSSYDEETLF